MFVSELRGKSKKKTTENEKTFETKQEIKKCLWNMKNNSVCKKETNFKD